MAAEIEFRRKQRGMSQTQLAALMGRQLANALRGHDPISAAAVSRLRQILLAHPEQRAFATRVVTPGPLSGRNGNQMAGWTGGLSRE